MANSLKSVSRAARDWILSARDFVWILFANKQTRRMLREIQHRSKYRLKHAKLPHVSDDHDEPVELRVIRARLRGTKPGPRP